MSENKEYVSQIEGQSNVHISGDAICTVAAVAAVEVEGGRYRRKEEPFQGHSSAHGGGQAYGRRVPAGDVWQ